MIKMIMCSVCKKNVAVIFTTKIENGKKVNMGLCIPCAKKMGISPIDGIIDNSEISEDDFSNVNKQMSEMLDSLKAQPSDDENNPFKYDKQCLFWQWIHWWRNSLYQWTKSKRNFQ